MHIIKGMVQVSGTTYRIVQVQAGSYQVIRICDEALAGTFSCSRTLKSVPVSVDALLMKQITRAAVRQGRTAWMGAGAAAA